MNNKYDEKEKKEIDFDSKDFMKHLKDVDFGHDQELLDIAGVEDVAPPIEEFEDIDYNIQNENEHELNALFSEMNADYRQKLDDWKSSVLKILKDFWKKESNANNTEQEQTNEIEFEYDEQGINDLNGQLTSFKDFMLSSFETKKKTTRNSLSKPKPQKEAKTIQEVEIDFNVYGDDDYTMLNNSSSKSRLAISWAKHALLRLHQRITSDLEMEQIKKQIEITVFEKSKTDSHNERLSVFFRADNVRKYKVGYTFAREDIIIIQTIYLNDKTSKEEYRQKKNNNFKK